MNMSSFAIFWCTTSLEGAEASLWIKCRLSFLLPSRPHPPQDRPLETELLLVCCVILCGSTAPVVHSPQPSVSMAPEATDTTLVEKQLGEGESEIK